MPRSDDDIEQAIADLKDELAAHKELYIDGAGNLSLFNEETSVFGDAAEAGIDAELVVSYMTDAILAAIPDEFGEVRLSSGNMGSGAWPKIDTDRLPELARLMPGWAFLLDGRDIAEEDDDD